jgi:hypothetical protein
VLVYSILSGPVAYYSIKFWLILRRTGVDPREQFENAGDRAATNDYAMDYSQTKPELRKESSSISYNQKAYA